MFPTAEAGEDILHQHQILRIPARGWKVGFCMGYSTVA